TFMKCDAMSLNARRSLLQINSLAYQHQLQLLPYFEMKAQFNQLLEDQKKRVKSLEQQVGQAKMSYAEALRNLEQISDEIHRVTSSPDPPSHKVSPPGLSSSSLPDTDVWSDSTGTGPPDSDSGEEFLRLPEKLGPNASPVVSKADRETTASQMSEYLGLSNLSGGRGSNMEDTNSSQPMAELAIRSQNTLQSVSMSPRHSITNKPSLKIMETSFVDKQQVSSARSHTSGNPFLSPGDNQLDENDDSNDQIWTEISLVDSPEEISQTFAKMGSVASRHSDRDYIQYSPLTEQTTPTSVFLKELSSNLLSENEQPQESVPNRKTLEENVLVEDCSGIQGIKPGDRICNYHPKAKLDSSLSGWISRSTASADVNGQNQNNLNRRQSLDTLLWGGPTTERVKELLSHGMMMLNISSLTERRASEPRATPDKLDQDNKITESRGNLAKKVPSPLEKSLTYLNAEDDSTSDSESLASVEMLTDEQISSLMLDQEIQDACEEVLGTPISEISPLIQDLKQREQQAHQTPKKTNSCIETKI
ncbi:hypothetical protein L9F63_002189, partial [Diploptera punctata]